MSRSSRLPRRPRHGAGALAAALVLLAVASPARPGTVLAAREADLEGCTRPAEVPPDAELEARDARIGRVEYAAGDVFEPELAARASAYRLANQLHLDTREATLQARLLFAPGEPYRRRLLDESERSLRAQRFLHDAQLQPVRWHEDARTVDVRVCTRDVWTLSPSVSFGRRGGASTWSAALEDQNLFGRGKHLALEHRSDPLRTSTALAYRDPNLLGSRWTAAADYALNSDGRLRALEFRRPFESLDARRAYAIGALERRSVEHLYADGVEAARFDARARAAELELGRSEGLVDGVARRVSAGWRFDERRFGPAPVELRLALPRALDAAAVAGSYVPPDRRLSYPWLGIEWLEDGYAAVRDLDQIGRTEDLQLGFGARLRAGLALPAFGADREALLLDGGLQWARPFGESRLVRLDASVSTRIEGGALVDAAATVGGRGYWRWGDRALLYGSAEVRLTHAQDPDRQVLLGGAEGLRGYPLHFQSGAGAALFSLEQRWYSDWEPFGLVRVGAAAFADLGRTWGGDAVGSRSLGWLGDVGAGLRLGNLRSARGNVLHLDVALPLSARDRVSGLQFLVATETRF